MPFTSEQFFQVFREYNLSVEPMQLIFHLLAVIVIFLVIRKNKFSDRTNSGILGFFWLWIGIVYHLIFFTSINKAAYIFEVMFIIQGILFVYSGIVREKFSFKYKSDVYGVTGVIFILYALIIYPILGYLAGHTYPDNPTFGLPCPTTIFTFGILLWANKKIPIYVIIIPTLWSVIGFFAALNFSVYEDVGLLIAGIGGFILILYRNKNQEFTQS
jgi:hypothetical protein